MSSWWKLLPGAGGGTNTMKRWVRFQQILNKKRWMEPDRERNGPITLFDFCRPMDAADVAVVEESSRKGGWRISDDSVIGGYSKASFDLVRTREDYHQVLSGKRPENYAENLEELEKTRAIPGSNDEGVNKDIVPFARWAGTIDTRVGEESDAQRSGFCAIRSPEFPFGGADLGGRFNALEILCRSDGRPYSVNLKVETFIPDDLYQCFINIPPTEESKADDGSGSEESFDSVVLLFQNFIVTSGGRMRASQRQLDTSIKFQSIGFTLMDGVPGDFQFDIARIRAVNYDESGIVGKVD